jgi:uncharacterized delta-60 repeat protein
VAVQSDGKIILVGVTANYTKIAVVRFNSSGSIDSTFDNDGIVTASVGTVSDQGYATTIQTDGKILVAAHSFSGANNDYALIRLNANGSLDATFGTAGRVLTDIYGDDLPYAISLQTDGKIVVAGISNNDFSVVRYRTDGSLDTSFDSDGKVRTSFGAGEDVATSLAIQSDGKIVLAGNTNSVQSQVGIALARYNSNGSLDASFDGDGLVTTSIPCTTFGIAVQTNGKILVSGHGYGGANIDFSLARFNSNGSIDLSFDSDGIVTTDYGFSKDDFAYSSLLQNDGKIIVVGYGYNPSFNNFMLARYNNDVTTSVSNVIANSINTIYPNPTTGILNIAAQNTDYSVKIINSMGKQIYAENCKANKASIDVNALAKGVYFLVVENGGGVSGGRFEKE